MTIFGKLFHRDTLEYEDQEAKTDASRVDSLESELTMLEKQLEVFNLERKEYGRASGS